MKDRSFKKIIASAFALSIVAGAASITPVANVFVGAPLAAYAENNESGNISYDTAKKVLTLSGNIDKTELLKYKKAAASYSIVAEEGTVLPDDCTGLFAGFWATSIDLSKVDTSNVTDMKNMFSSCSSLRELNISNFNTSNVTDMSDMFHGCVNLTALDLRSFDTSSLKKYKFIFAKCTRLETIYVSEKWDLSKAEHKSAAVFDGCVALKGAAGTAYKSAYNGYQYAVADGVNGNVGLLTGKIEYIDADGAENYVTDYKVLTGTETAKTLNYGMSAIVLDGGTYVVNKELNYTSSLIFIGDTKLILTDSAKLTVDITSNDASRFAIGVSEDEELEDAAKLEIYGQSKGTGELSSVTNGFGIMADDYTQYGGKVNVELTGNDDGDSAALLAKNITLNGGSLTDSSTDNEYPTIWVGGVNLNGGTLNLYKFIANFDFDDGVERSFTIADGLCYTDGTNGYQGTLSADEISGLDSKSLTVAHPVVINNVDFNGGVNAITVYAETFTTSGTYSLPNAPYLDGFDFNGWFVNDELKTTDDDALDAISELIEAGETEITVAVDYEQSTDEYELTINNAALRDGEEGGSFLANTRLYAVAKAHNDAGEKFGWWQLGDDEEAVVGYETTYDFHMPSDDMVLTAVYVPEDTVIVKKGIGFIESVKSHMEDTLTFVSILTVPDDCQMLKAGVVAQATDALNGEELTTENARFVRFSDTSEHTFDSFKYTYTLTINNHDWQWTVRPYLEYIDQNGVSQTIYGKAVSKCINDVNVVTIIVE